MRTTLTLDHDVAALLQRVQKSRKARFKDVVNEALRQGLQEMSAPPKRRARFQTPVLEVGACLVGSIDNVAEALAYAEGDNYR